MKIRNTKFRYISLALLLATIPLTQSCNKDFLDEELTTQRSTDYYKTEEGIQALAIAAYNKVLAVPFYNENQYTSLNSGTDEFVIGGDDSNGVWNNYSVAFQSSINAINSNTVGTEEQWDLLYLGINVCNQLVQYSTDIQSANPAIKEVALGEGYFFRAYSYLRLVRQFGGVPLKLDATSTVQTEFVRATPEAIYAQIIDDLTKAYDLIPNTGAPARVSKDAVAHYLAKAYLSRASEINDSWNGTTKQADLEKVVTLSDEVISHHPLAANYSELWNYTKPNGPNESLPEIILSAQFTNDLGATTANFSCTVFAAKYDDLPFMKRDLTGMRPYTRLAPSYFTYEIFDGVNDSRFWKSFRTKHRLNNASGTTYVNGDLGIMYVINNRNDNSFAQTKYLNTIVYATTNKTIPSVYVAHASDGRSLLSEPRFPSLSKHYDASRLTVNDTRGYRDAIVARSAETYLMAAEANIRLAAIGGSGSYTAALNYINTVRERAALKNNEVRSNYVDGGAAYPSSPLNQPVSVNSYMPENSYYESTHIAPTTAATSLSITGIGAFPAEDEAVVSRLGYSSDYDRMLCLVLNERARELCGEFHRWEDLARTKTLVKRVQAYNPTAAPNIKDFHNLRPIPQTFLDLITANGSALTPDQKQAMQNPGY